MLTTSILRRLAGTVLAATLFMTAGCGGDGGGGGSSSSSSSAGGGGISGFGTSSSSSSSSSVAPVPLAQLSIVTDAGAAVRDKDTYIGGTLTIPAIAGHAAYSGRMDIKGRGNSTWDMHPKKPYRIKLSSKAGLLGMPADKNWVLLANHSDKTLLRNRTAFEFSQRLGIAWTPRAVPVEVTLNGVYLGAYDLVEQIRVADDRVDITEMDAGMAPLAGGFLAEINERMDDPVCWRTTRNVALCLKSPDPSSTAQNTYIQTYIQAAEDALFSANPTHPATGYEHYFDVDALIDWYLVNELFKNPDSAGWGSTYVYTEKGGKLTFGPVWDFDLAAGNTDYFDGSPQGFHTATGVWIARMKQIDPTFSTRVRARWNAIKAPYVDTLPAWIDVKAAELASAQSRNFTTWPILKTYVWPNPQVAGSYSGEVTYFRNWLTQRIAWLDANL